MVEIKNCPVEIANDIWNAAIEQAAIKVEKFHKWIGSSDLANIIDKEGIANEIRRLKK